MKNKNKSNFKTEKNQLNIELNNALKDKKSIQGFLDISKKIAMKSLYVNEHALRMGDCSAKLMFNGINDDDYNFVKKIFYHYVNELLPYIGIYDKNTDVASMGLVFSKLSNNNDVAAIVFEKLLAQDFDIFLVDNEILLYNLACYYALNKNKAALLMAVKQALKQGIGVHQFMSDADFKHYWKDVEFITTVSENSFGIEFRMECMVPTHHNIHIDTSIEKLEFMEESLHEYITVNQKEVEMTIYAIVEEGWRSAVARNVKVKNISQFLRELNESVNLSVGEMKIISVGDENFMLGLVRSSEEEIIYYNACRLQNNKTIVDVEVYKNDFKVFINEVKTLVQGYHQLQQQLKKYIDHFINFPVWSEQQNGIRIRLKTNNLFEYQLSPRLFEMEIKNITEQSIYFIDNIHISSCCERKLVELEINIGPDKNPVYKPFIKLKSNESMVFQVNLNTSYFNHIHLSFCATHHRPMRVCPYFDTPAEARVLESYSSTWSGKIIHEIPVFTIDKEWQKNMNIQQDFTSWVKKFKADTIPS